MQPVYSISWQTPGRVLVSAAISCGNGERKMSVAEEEEEEERGQGSYAEHSLGECGVTGMCWSSPGGWEGY